MEIGLQNYYLSGYLILVHLTAFIGMGVVVMLWLVFYIFFYKDYAEGEDESQLALDFFRVLQLAIVVMKFSLVMLMLFMFI